MACILLLINITDTSPFVLLLISLKVCSEQVQAVHAKWVTLHIDLNQGRYLSKEKVPQQQQQQQQHNFLLIYMLNSIAKSQLQSAQIQNNMNKHVDKNKQKKTRKKYKSVNVT
jgi:hypothetical protein